MHLRCGHTIHTACFLHQAYLDNIQWFRVSCETCDTTLIGEEHIQLLQQIEYPRRDPTELVNLWNNNEAFREEVHNLVKDEKKVKPIMKQFKEEAAVLKREWKEAILTSKSYLREQKRIFIKRYTHLPSYRKLRNGLARINRLSRRILHTYDLRRWSLDDLTNVPGAPKIKREFYRRLFRIRPMYVFGIRI